MKLLYDLFYAQPLAGSKFHGGGEYMKTVFKHLVIKYSVKNTIETFLNPDEFVDDWIFELIKMYNIKTYVVHSKSDISKILKEQYYDVFYTGMPYQYDNIILLKDRRNIATIHGLRAAEKNVDYLTPLYLNNAEKLKSYIRLLLPGYFTARAVRRYKKCIEKFDAIITDSKHSNYAMQVWFRNPNHKEIVTFYAPQKVNDHKSLSGEKIQKEQFPPKYVLLLGGNRWEKNAYRAIVALEELFDNEKLDNYSIVVGGRLSDQIKKRIKHISRYVFYDFIETNYLEALYRNCDFFLYPTLNEGFGMPPLEAMRYGKTCVVSAVCSLPEICGDAVYYVNPYDIKELENRILYASKEKINTEKVLSRARFIAECQKKDLDRLCEYILGSGHSDQ